MRSHRVALGAAVALAFVALASTVTACADTATTANTTATSRTASTSTPAPSTPASSAPAAVASCTTGQLSITLTNTGALAGQAGGYLKFTNDASTTCRITGWPTVAGLTAAGRATTFRQARSTMYGAWQYAAPLPVVTLRHGDSAYAVVAADDNPAGTQSSCPSPDVRLRVAAPGSQRTVTISAWLPGARTYLPTCASINGTTVNETSAITTLSALPH
jgi:hypothetical protein